MNQFQRNVVIILAKKPVPGRTKTRIAKDTSDMFAYKLGLYSFEDLLHNLQNSNHYDLIVGTDNLEDLEWFENDYNLSGIVVDVPKEANLSDRMNYVFKTLTTTFDYQKVILVPMDMPFLQDDEIISAFTRLDQSPFTVGPETNGGVYLIGMNANSYKKNIFDNVAWSTPHSSETLINNFGRKNTYKLKLKDDLNTFDEILNNKDQIKLFCPKLFRFITSEGYFSNTSEQKYINFDELNICVPTVSAIVERTNQNGELEILLQTRNKPVIDPTYAGRLEVPSGLIERYENAQKTVIREVKEETGLDVALVSPSSLKTYEGISNDLVIETEPYNFSQQVKGGRAYINLGFVCHVLDEKQNMRENADETMNPSWYSINAVSEMVKKDSGKFFPICLPLIIKYIEEKNGKKRSSRK